MSDAIVVANSIHAHPPTQLHPHPHPSTSSSQHGRIAQPLTWASTGNTLHTRVVYFSLLYYSHRILYFGPHVISFFCSLHRDTHTNSLECFVCVCALLFSFYFKYLDVTLTPSRVVHLFFPPPPLLSLYLILVCAGGFFSALTCITIAVAITCAAIAHRTTVSPPPPPSPPRTHTSFHTAFYLSLSSLSPPSYKL